MKDLKDFYKEKLKILDDEKILYSPVLTELVLWQ